MTSVLAEMLVTRGSIIKGIEQLAQKLPCCFSSKLPKLLLNAKDIFVLTFNDCRKGVMKNIE